MTEKYVLEDDPEYQLFQKWVEKVRPGISGWGMRMNMWVAWKAARDERNRL